MAGEQDAAARAAWRQMIATADPRSLFFLDETSTPTTMTPRRARSPRGTRVVDRVPRGKWESVTLLATLTPTGLGPGFQFTGALDRDAFEAFVEELLVPTLTPGQTVVLDNLSVHKSATARALIEAAGCALVFLPTSSPDFNPIEQAFAKLKQAARTVDAILSATEAAYPLITPADTRGFFTDCGDNL
ncbi:MAG: IS630 family transposase [Thermomicrobiales bacterium]